MMKYLSSAIIIILLITGKSMQILLIPKIGPPNSIFECINYIFNKYLVNSTKVSFKSSDRENSITTDFMKKIELPIVINLEETEIEGIDTRRPSDVIIIVGVSINISKYINESKWTTTTQFLVIANRSQLSEQKMIDIFQQFWTNNIVNVVILAIKNNDIYIYTFIPFNPHDCAVHKPVLLAIWSSGRISSSIEIIQKERVTNLHGCILNASVVNIDPAIIFPNIESMTGSDSISGIEGFTLTEISKKLNFKLHIALPKDEKGFGRIKPVPHGAVGELFHKKSHFACGRISDTPDRYKYLDMSVPISCVRECVSWVLPIGAKKSSPEWITLYIKGFTKTVWCLVIITFACVIGTFFIASKSFANDRHRSSGIVKIIFYILKSSLGASVQTPKSSVLRAFFLAWLWYCFIIITAYQALLGSKLTVPRKLPNVETFKDLVESDLRIEAALGIYKTLSHGREEKEIKEIDKRVQEDLFDYKKIQEYHNEAMVKMISGDKTAHLWSTTTVLYNTLVNPKIKGLVHFMKECLYKYYAVMLLQKNCPFTRRVNKIIRALSETGIICKWRSQYAYDIPQAEPEVKKLTLNRMTGAFVILGGGIGAAVVAFLTECVFYWYSSNKLRCFRRIKTKFYGSSLN